VNYRNTAAAISFPNGLTTRPPVMSAHPERGLIFEYSAMGVPVVNLIDVRGLALKSGLPIDPIPFPPVGEAVYTMFVAALEPQLPSPWLGVQLYS